MFCSLYFILILWSFFLKSTAKDESKDEVPPPPKPIFYNVPEDYDITEIPRNESWGPMNVSLLLDVWSIREVSPQRMDIEMEVYVSVVWRDLSVEPQSKAEAPMNDWLALRSTDVANLWHPNLKFRTSYLSSVPISFTNALYFWRQRDYHFMAITSVLERFHCWVDYSSFPMDRQTCFLMLESHNSLEVALLPYESPDTELMMKNRTFAEYAIRELSYTNCTKTPYESMVVPGCLEVTLRMERHFGHYGMCLYAPSFVVVMFTWVSFWLPIDALLARVMLLLVLTLATVITQARWQQQPPVAYCHASDVWLTACLIMVFAALVEYTVAHYLWRKRKFQSAVADLKTGSVVKHVNPIEIMRESTPAPGPGSPVLLSETMLVDQLSRFIFPAVFIVFNAIYWNAYCRY